MPKQTGEIKVAVDTVIAGLKRIAEGGEWPEDEAREAAGAAWAAYGEAAWAAAEAAYWAAAWAASDAAGWAARADRKSTRLNSSHGYISYAGFGLKKKNTKTRSM